MLDLSGTDLQDYADMVVFYIEKFAKHCIAEKKSNELCKEVIFNWLYVESYIYNLDIVFVVKLKSLCESLINFYYEVLD